MRLFPSIRSSESNLSEDLSEKRHIPVFHSVEFTLSTIVDKISNIDNLHEQEIKNIILRQHKMILNYDLFLKSDESRKHAQKLFTNKRFLENFLDIIGLLDLSSEEIICINKLAYDYYISQDNNQEISNLLLQISYQINNVLVIRLSGKLGMNGARILSMISNSSFKVEKKVHRINTFLMRCNVDLSIQDIVDIYCIIFERFTYPFIYTMLEPKPANLSQEQAKRFDDISIAILTILNSMTSDDMKKILFNYAYTIKLLKTNVSKDNDNRLVVRFALKTAIQYPRMLVVIESIEMDAFEDLFIP